MTEAARSDGVAVARRLATQRYPQARAAWWGGSVAAGTATETSDLDITVLLSGSPAPFRQSETIAEWPVEWFVQTEDSLPSFCHDDRTRRRRPTTMRLVGSAIVLIDNDGSGPRLQPLLLGHRERRPGVGSVATFRGADPLARLVAPHSGPFPPGRHHCWRWSRNEFERNDALILVVAVSEPTFRKLVTPSDTISRQKSLTPDAVSERQ